MATVSELLIGVTDPGERARIKAREHVSRGSSLAGTSFAYKGVDITITQGPVLSGDGMCVQVSVAASTGSGRNRVALPVDNPYLFYNPPICKVVTPAVLGPLGSVITPAVLSEDIIGTAKTMLGDAVLAKARLMGWAG